jgi:hypothetical protein
MFRLVSIISFAAACAAEPAISTEQSDVSLGFSREHVTADIYHYTLVLPVGDSPNAALRIHRVVRERAPFVPRATQGAAMLLHGDFSTFDTSFLPAMAPYLAGHGIDVWGVDRRWTLATDDISDLATMGVAQEVADVRAAIAFARAARGSAEKIALVGFSHGGQLAYAVAGVEGGLPASQRQVDAIVPLDWYGDLEDPEMRALTCDFSAQEYQLVADGVTDAANDFVIELGELARTAPDDPSPTNPNITNRTRMLRFIGQTYRFAEFAPFYHLGAPILEGSAVVGLRESPESEMIDWLAAATPHQSMLEAADFDALLCGSGPQPVDAPLANVRVPLFYIGAAGGIGSLGIHATTRVSSADVSTMVVQRFGPERRAEDFGHADLLFATDAPALVFQPLTTWLLHH